MSPQAEGHHDDLKALHDASTPRSLSLRDWISLTSYTLQIREDHSVYYRLRPSSYSVPFARSTRLHAPRTHRPESVPRGAEIVAYTPSPAL